VVDERVIGQALEIEVREVAEGRQQPKCGGSARARDSETAPEGKTSLSH
jgi:hypothetical protein